MCSSDLVDSNGAANLVLENAAVGSVVGQLAKLQGCRAVGIAGGPAKALTHSIAWEMQPRFSPDGKQIAFVLQGGGYDINYKPIEEHKSIFNESGNGLKNQIGTIAMARLNDPHSATSQFFFNLQDNSHLDPGRSWGYAVFGYITEGQDVIEKIRAIQTDTSVELGWPNVPVEKVVLKTVIVLPEQ